jgi:hypothetical protein
MHVGGCFTVIDGRRKDNEIGKIQRIGRTKPATIEKTSPLTLESVTTETRRRRHRAGGRDACTSLAEVAATEGRVRGVQEKWTRDGLRKGVLVFPN